MCFVLSDSQCAKKHFTASIPLLGAFYGSIGIILGILLNVLRNLKHYFDILYECLDTTVVVIKLKKCVGSLPVLWRFLAAFSPFCSMLLK